MNDKRICPFVFLVRYAIVLALLLILVWPMITGQNTQQKVTRQSASDAFARGKFETALGMFTELLNQYPKDPLYKYYKGACLVKLEKDPQLASDMLLDAVKASAAMRSVPNDGFFYLGRARQMAGRYKEAIKAYDQFTGLAGKKAARDLNVEEFIEQCEKGQGKIMVTETKTVPEVKEVFKPPVIESKSDTVVKREEVPVRKNIIPREELPATYDELLAYALLNQALSDSLAALASISRSRMAGADPSVRTVIRDSVTALEKLSSDYREIAEKSIAKARELNPLPHAVTTIAAIPDSIISNEVVLKDSAMISDKAKMKFAADTINKAVPEMDTAAVVAEEVKIDTVAITEKPPVRNVVPEQIEDVFSEFSVIEKPVFPPDGKVTVNPEVPQGLIYRIQVAVFRNPVAPSYFKGLSPMNGFRNETTGLTIYYAGSFRKNSDASMALVKVKSLGFKDAFVASLMDKKPVSADRATLLEKEWGNKPLYTRKTVKTEVAADTVPPTLVFRVEVKRSLRPLPSDQVETIKKMAATRGLDILTADPKQTVYLIGKFLSFKSASEYTDLLVRNGYREAKVVAYMGKKEIPVETARQLFEEN